MAEIKDYTTEYKVWHKSMKKTHKLLVPDLLPWHFSIMMKVLNHDGFNIEVLKNESREVIDEGLKHVHNDTCYPCLCITGQYINALKSGKYDLDRTVLVISQTGGGCRASNYMALVRKALYKEFPQVPVASVNFSGLSDSSIKVKLPLFLKMAYCMMYADSVMWCYNQTKPYEKEEGQADEARDKAIDFVLDKFFNGGYRKYQKITAEIINIFAQVPRTGESKIKVGIVGEIYVKYSTLGNNNLVNFLLSENCEPVVPALMDFVLYCVVNVINDYNYYGHKPFTAKIYKSVYKILLKMQRKTIEEFEKEGTFLPPHNFEHLRSCADKVINQGVKMGEGWLIPAEMCAFAETGVKNVVCAQPFGCLPNHIVGKGAVRALKNLYPEENVVAVDYDPSATKVNQENRIKLMLATARENLNK